MQIKPETLHALLDSHIEDINNLTMAIARGILPLPTTESLASKAAGSVVSGNFLSLLISKGPIGRTASAILKHEMFGRSLISKGDIMLSLAEQSAYPKAEELKKAVDLMKDREASYDNKLLQAARFSPL